MASRKRSRSNGSDSSLTHKEWDGALCPICMEHPHNAVLLICSSHDKGCRSYICDTSHRHSNCLDRFKKLKGENSDNPSSDTTPLSENHHTDASNDDNPHPTADPNIEKSEEGSNLRCPLCRGSILGFKVVQEARRHLNLKSRSCSRESCPFSGNYRELRGHARRVHPTARPAEVDPLRQRAWRQLQDQREYDDMVSAVRSAMPGALIMGDYVVENGNRPPPPSSERVGNGGGGEGGRLLSTFFLLQMIGSMEARGMLRGGERRTRALAAVHRRASSPSSISSSSRRRFLWGENLLGINNDDDHDDDDGDDDEEDDEDEEEDEEETEENDRNDDEPDLNLLSDLGDDDNRLNRRRRRRIRRDRSDDDQQ